MQGVVQVQRSCGRGRIETSVWRGVWAGVVVSRASLQPPEQDSEQGGRDPRRVDRGGRAQEGACICRAPWDLSSCPVLVLPLGCWALDHRSSADLPQSELFKTTQTCCFGFVGVAWLGSLRRLLGRFQPGVGLVGDSA